MPTNVKQSYDSESQEIYPVVLIESLKNFDASGNEETGYNAIKKCIVNDGTPFNFTDASGMGVNKMTITELHVGNLFANIASISNIKIDGQAETTKTVKVLNVIDNTSGGDCHSLLGTSHKYIMVAQTGKCSDESAYIHSSDDGFVVNDNAVTARMNEIHDKEGISEYSSDSGEMYFKTGNFVVDTGYVYINNEANSIGIGADVELKHTSDDGDSSVKLYDNGIIFGTSNSEFDASDGSIRITSSNSVIVSTKESELSTQKIKVYNGVDGMHITAYNKSNIVIECDDSTEDDPDNDRTYPVTIDYDNGILLNKPVQSNAQIRSKVNNIPNVYNGCPIGTIVMWMSETAPEHWVSLKDDITIKISGATRESASNYKSDSSYVSVIYGTYCFNFKTDDTVAKRKYKYLFESLGGDLFVLKSNVPTKIKDLGTDMTGITQLIIPNMSYKFPMCYDSVGSHYVSATYGYTKTSVGATGGVDAVLLQAQESGIRQHVHKLSSVKLNLGLGEYGSGGTNEYSYNKHNGTGTQLGLASNSQTDTTTQADANTAHVNLPPYMALNFIIKYE